jgi:hypothetical protein
MDIKPSFVIRYFLPLSFYRFWWNILMSKVIMAHLSCWKLFGYFRSWVGKERNGSSVWPDNYSVRIFLGLENPTKNLKKPSNRNYFKVHFYTNSVCFSYSVKSLILIIKMRRKHSLFECFSKWCNFPFFPNPASIESRLASVSSIPEIA